MEQNVIEMVGDAITEHSVNKMIYQQEDVDGIVQSVDATSVEAVRSNSPRMRIESLDDCWVRHVPVEGG